MIMVTPQFGLWWQINFNLSFGPTWYISQRVTKQGVWTIIHHNSVYINQYEYRFKIHCQTYLTHIINSKFFDAIIFKSNTLPIHSHITCMKSIKSAIIPKESVQNIIFGDSTGFKYRCHRACSSVLQLKYIYYSNLIVFFIRYFFRPTD